MRIVGWSIKIVWYDSDEIKEYRAIAGTMTAAIRKVIKEITKENNGHEPRLGQGDVHIVICRTHKKEIARWEGKGKKTLR